MTHRDTWNTYQWEGSYGDPDGDAQDRWSRRQRLGPEFPFTLIARCKSCDGYFPDMRAYAGQIVSDTRATTCHHCRGEVPCDAGKHLVRPGAVCWVCEVYKADPSK